MVLELVSPSSVVDVGCGVGTWLSVFKSLGVKTVLGMDGNYISPGQLKISESEFLVKDLSQEFEVPGKFDLVVSLEVAEHLPALNAKSFVSSLTSLAPVVLFSAAQPHQGGKHHINEQWPEYWTKLFGEAGYEVVDPIRRRVWNNPKVEWWYAQNILLFVKSSVLESFPNLVKAKAQTSHSQLSIVHPSSLTLHRIISMTPGLFRGVAARKWHKFRQKINRS